MIGKPSVPDNMAVMSCSKHRRQPPQENIIVQIDGMLSRVKAPEGRYVVDTRSRRIMLMSDRDNLPGGEDVGTLPPPSSQQSEADQAVHESVNSGFGSVEDDE